MRRATVLAAVGILLALVPGAARAGTPAHGVLGFHTMLYLDHADAVRARVLDAAVDAGARQVRVDVQLNALFAASFESDWSALDALRADLRRRGLRAVGVLYGTPAWLAACGTPPAYRCMPRDLDAWAALVEATVRRAPEIRSWEVLNEPDVPDAFFHGGACDYTALLARTSAAIRSARPSARILLGGTAGPHASWLRALQACDSAFATRFDVASLHARGSVRAVAKQVREERRLLGYPVWVTEMGTPSDPAYLCAAVPAAWRAGARVVFVTARDSGEFGSSPYASEGVLRWPSLDPKPALAALQTLTGR